eukprot:GHVS01036408.1.p1 GENE.GHVS01036408.1~~GHVS01036408.1.p1  ORF type:complete len:419 (+),score=53.99 GHVS01036408.1:165-1421(+)
MGRNDRRRSRGGGGSSGGSCGGGGDQPYSLVYINPSSCYPLWMYLRDPLCHALLYNFTTACFGLLFLYLFFHELPRWFCSYSFWVAVVAVGCAWLWGVRQICNGSVFHKNNKLHIKDLSKLNIVITGGGGGIGCQCACVFARCGANIIIGCRNMKKGLPALESIRACSSQPDQKIEMLALDLENEQSIRDFVTSIQDKRFSIDVLINNAAVMMPPRLRLSKSGMETQFCTNHMGHFLLTHLLLDNIKATSGRIINVSSMAHGCTTSPYTGYDIAEVEDVDAKNYDSLRYYGISKISNIWFTKELQRRLGQTTTNVTAYCMHPGAVKSDLYRNIELLARSCFNPLTPLVENLLLKSTVAGAYTHIYLATADKSELHPGAYYTDCDVGHVITAGNNMDKAKELWQWSEMKWNLLPQTTTS